MKKFFILLGGLITFLIFTNGCAFTKTTVAINYKAPAYSNKVDVGQLIVVQRLNDLRGGDPYLLSYKGVGMKTSGTYVAEKEIADIITDAIKDTLSNLNYKVVGDQGDMVLSGELIKLDSTPLMGFWSGSLDCTIQINLKLSDAKDGKLVWNDTLTGFNKLTGLQIDSERNREKNTEAAIADLMQKIAESTDFKMAIQQFKTQ